MNRIRMKYLEAQHDNQATPAPDALTKSSYITNSYDSLGRLTGTYLKNSGATVLNSHAYTYDYASRRTSQTRADGSYVDYAYDGAGQLKTAGGAESGGTTNRV